MAVVAVSDVVAAVSAGVRRLFGGRGSSSGRTAAVPAPHGPRNHAFVFEVIRKPAGWYVVGISAIGPFERREPAERLARELVLAVNADGGEARLVTP